MSYSEIQTNLESSYQQRVVDEHKELSDRMVKLWNFSQNPKFKTLPEKEQILLGQQYRAMHKYQLILEARIRLFPVPM